MFAPLISIIIPVYNGANYLRDAIDSALAQTYSHCEVLVINDGSDDGGATEAIATSYGERIRYFTKPNGGVGSALNMGIEQMRGEFFSWLSHDAVYLPDRCSLLLSYWNQQNHKRCIIYADTEIIDDCGRKRSSKSPPEFLHTEILCRIWGQSFLNGCTMLIPHFLLVETGGFNEDLPTTQDYDLWLRLAHITIFCRFASVVVQTRSHAVQDSQKHVHYRECSLLLVHHVPMLVQNLRQQDGGFKQAAPLLAYGIVSRVGDYGLHFACMLFTAFARHTTSSEQRTLCLLLLKNTPYAILRWMWLCLPEAFRLSLKKNFGYGYALINILKTNYHSGGPRATLYKSTRYIKRIAGRIWRVACARTVHNAPPNHHVRQLYLLIDHDSGGGAYAFRKQYTTHLLDQGNDVLVWQYLVGIKYYFFELHSKHSVTTYSARTLEEARTFVCEVSPEVVFFNNMVGWPRIADTLDVLLSLQTRGSRLHIFLHDYFTVCPAYPLLNKKGKFCGIPLSTDVCQLCLPNHPLAAPYDSMIINEWRGMWQNFLSKVDNITTADSSVVTLLQRVYPVIAHNIHIEPHTPLEAWNPLPPSPPGAPTVLGIIGNITRHKGAGIVEDILHLLEEKRLDMRIVVIGSLESSSRSPMLHICGEYNHKELPLLLQKHCVTVCLVPSPLPETFCYVAQEIEMLGLPLVCLDIGAQGIRAARYAKGYVAATPDAEGCLHAVLHAVQNVY